MASTAAASYAHEVPSRYLRLKPKAPTAADDVDARVLEGLVAVRATLDVPDEFNADVTAEAEAAGRGPRMPDLDKTQIPFVTIDPPESMDLDQAVHIARRGDGYRVTYAIADVAAYVAPGGAIDREAWSRVFTLYGPDERTPLHPLSLSEDAASLLPDKVRPALLWEIDLDSAGAQESVNVRRALVRSRAKLSYEEVQRRLDAGEAAEPLLLLREVGELREQIERERGGMTLPSPEQEVVRTDGHWALVNRGVLPVEEWNAQISLLTGMAAAGLMLDAGVGVVRTLPPADHRDVARLERSARALHVEWPEDLSYQEFVRGLDPTDPAHAALIVDATSLLRGAGYASFDGDPPEAIGHAAIGAPYAHVTAPLRRLVDRYAGEICLAMCDGGTVPDWVRAALPKLPDTMSAGDRRASSYERACLDVVEAALLEPRVGEEFRGVVVDVDPEKPRGTVQLEDPAVRARVVGDGLPLGEELTVRLVKASVRDREVLFEPAR